MVDQLQADTNKDIAYAKQGLGAVGWFAVDVGVGAVQLAGDMTIGAATGGSAAIPVAVRSFGGKAQEARQEGASQDKQVAAGLTSALTGLVTEKLSSVGNIQTEAFGSGALDDIMEGVVAAVERTGKTKAGRAALNRLASAGVGAFGEGLEEGLESVIDQTVTRRIYSDEPIDWKQVAADAAYSALVGGAIGGITGGIGGTNTSARNGTAETQLESTGRPFVGKDTESAKGRTTDMPNLPTARNMENLADDRGTKPSVDKVIPAAYNETTKATNVPDRKDAVDETNSVLPGEVQIESRVTREIDENGSPIFATNRVDANIEGVDHAALKEARKKADAEYGLTDKEAGSLAGYISTTFAMLNRRMYTGTIAEKDMGVVERITSALEKFPVFEGTTYRNLKFSNEEQYNAFLAEHAEGSEISVKAFTSTSKRPNGYPKFGQYVVHMVIEGKSGADISNSYGVPRQQEVILLPGAALKITKVTTANDGTPLIYAQEVSAHGVETNHGDAESARSIEGHRGEGGQRRPSDRRNGADGGEIRNPARNLDRGNGVLSERRERPGELNQKGTDKDGMISDIQTRTCSAVREELERMGKEYGWIKAGEDPVRDVRMPSVILGQDDDASNAATYEIFARGYRQKVNPKATGETIRKSYDGFQKETQTIRIGDRTVTRPQFRQVFRGLTDEQLNEFFDFVRGQIKYPVSKEIFVRGADKLKASETLPLVRKQDKVPNTSVGVVVGSEKETVNFHTQNEQKQAAEFMPKEEGRVGTVASIKGSGSKSSEETGGTVKHVATIDFADKGSVFHQLEVAEQETAELDYEVNCSITTDGRVWRVSGEKAAVNPALIPCGLEGSYSYHNHPSTETWYSFSAADAAFFIESGEVYSKASDDMFEYVMFRKEDTLTAEYEVVYNRFKEIQRTDVRVLMWEEAIDPDFDEYHETMKILSREFHFDYMRRKKDGR